MANDFTMYAGDDKTLTVTVVDGDGAVVDITNAQSIKWQLSKTVTRTALLEKTLAAGVEIISGGAGRFDVTIDSADTEDLRAGEYYHEAEVTDENGEIATVFSGTVTILPTLIKPAVSP